MNDSEFEAELRALTPATPPGAMQRAIESELASGPRILTHASLPAQRLNGHLSRMHGAVRARLFPALCWAGAGAAAAVAIATLATHKVPSIGSPAPRAVAEGGALFDTGIASSELLAMDDAGVYYTGDHQPAELLHYSSLERHSWTNRATGARVEVEVPREDVVLVPLSVQ